MKDKIKAYNKISQVINSSKNELHLQTCSLMIGLFNIRFNDESMKAILKNEMDNKRRTLMKRSRYKDALVTNH